MSKNRKIVGHSSGVMLQRIIGMKLGRNALGVSGPSDVFCPISVTLSAFSRLVFTQDRGGLISAWSHCIKTLACLVILCHRGAISPLITRCNFN